jgi:hypothetical protein
MDVQPSRLARGHAAMLGFLVVLLVALGVSWGLSRVKYRERPRWSDAAFPALQPAQGAVERWNQRWAVAVRLGCPHCRISLESLAAARDRFAPDLRVTALLVDTDAPPPDSVLVLLPADEVRWDHEGRWRRRWGHGVYGEVLCFEPDGRLRRTLPPFGDMHDAVRRLEGRAMVEAGR